MFLDCSTRQRQHPLSPPLSGSVRDQYVFRAGVEPIFLEKRYDSSLTLVKTGRHPLEESLPNYWSWAAPVLEVILVQTSLHLYSSCHLLLQTQQREFPSVGQTRTPQTPHSSCGLCAAVWRSWAGPLGVTSWSRQDWDAGQSGARRECCGEKGSRQSWRKGCWSCWRHSNNESWYMRSPAHSSHPLGTQMGQERRAGLDWHCADPGLAWICCLSAQKSAESWQIWRCWGSWRVWWGHGSKSDCFALAKNSKGKAQTPLCWPWIESLGIHKPAETKRNI